LFMIPVARKTKALRAVIGGAVSEAPGFIAVYARSGDPVVALRCDLYNKT
jgi:hypothetical protein